MRREEIPAQRSAMRGTILRKQHVLDDIAGRRAAPELCRALWQDENVGRYALGYQSS
jgi:hypothetical protein